MPNNIASGDNIKILPNSTPKVSSLCVVAKGGKKVKADLLITMAKRKYIMSILYVNAMINQSNVVP